MVTVRRPPGSRAPGSRAAAGLPALLLVATWALMSAACEGEAVGAWEQDWPGAGTVVVLDGGTILDGTGGPAIDDGVVVLSADTIACVGAPGECAVPAGADVRDVSGRYLTPGLIDAHVHFSQTGWLDGRPDGIDLRAVYPYEPLVAELRSHPDRFFESYLCAGVTGVFDVGGFRWTIEMARAREGDPRAPHIQAAGPLVSHAELEVLATEADGSQFIGLTSAEAGRSGVQELAALGADAVKVWYLSPTDTLWAEIEDRVRAVAREASAAGLPLIVHATELRTARVAVDAGAFMLVHSVIDQLVDDEFVALVKERGTIYAPTLIVFRNWGRALQAAVNGSAPTWEDPLDCVDEWTAEKLQSAPQRRERVADERFTPEYFEAARERGRRAQEIMAANLRRLHAAAVPIVLATDAGNPLTLHGASAHWELEAMEAAGIPPDELIEIATRNGARALMRPDLGTLEAGKVADLLVLSEDPRESSAAFRSLEAVFHMGVEVAGRQR